MSRPRPFLLGASIAAAAAAMFSEPVGFADGPAYRAPRKPVAAPEKKAARKRQKKARAITRRKP